MAVRRTKTMGRLKLWQTKRASQIIEATRSALEESGKHPPLRLLLVEDHYDTAQTVTSLLRSAGFTVTTVQIWPARLQRQRERSLIGTQGNQLDGGTKLDEMWF